MRRLLRHSPSRAFLGSCGCLLVCKGHYDPITNAAIAEAFSRGLEKGRADVDAAFAGVAAPDLLIIDDPPYDSWDDDRRSILNEVDPPSLEDRARASQLIERGLRARADGVRRRALLGPPDLAASILAVEAELTANLREVTGDDSLTVRYDTWPMLHVPPPDLDDEARDRVAALRDRWRALYEGNWTTDA